MSLYNYVPLSFEKVRQLPNSYEQLKELCSRGLYWISQSGNGNDKNKIEVTRHKDEIFKEMGYDVFEKLFGQTFDASLYPYFNFSKEMDDTFRLLRNCGRNVFIHSLRATKHAKDAGSDIYTQKLTLLHDVVENAWKFYIVISNLQRLGGKNFQYISKINFNFMNFDIAHVNADALKQEFLALPEIIEEKFGYDVRFGVMKLTNMKSIENNLSVLDKSTVKYVDETYLSDLTSDALSSKDEKFLPILEARHCDRIDNMITMMYLLPKHQLRFFNKTITHLNGSIDVMKEFEIKKDSSFDKLMNILMVVSEEEATRNILYHSAAPIEGYNLEYRVNKYAKDFSQRLGQLKEIKEKYEELKRIKDINENLKK
ncbi:MAG: hypothetical protein Q8O89_04530 [Nanoarchaeota archaeon]|nr:hypothetical protein [Nanoarchaeota archaeon]